MFEGFQRRRIPVSGAEISLVVGGEGPPLLLLHGFPQTHATWHRVAPTLAERFTVVAPDLRGYGASSKPAGGAGHAAYAKAAMARDQIETMAALGFHRFAVVGHDRGARAAYRLALDHPGVVERLALLDLIPSDVMWGSMDQGLAIESYHWLFLAQPAPLPERLIGGAPEFYLRWTLNSWAARPEFWSEAAYADYLAAISDAATLHAMCEDYRAGATIDAVAAAGDAERRLACPLLVLWGRTGADSTRFDHVAIWRPRAVEVTARAIACGHFLQEEAPEETFAALLPFLRGSG